MPIDEIGDRSTKRKIYYYFEGKDELYRAVLGDPDAPVERQVEQAALVRGMQSGHGGIVGRRASSSAHNSLRESLPTGVFGSWARISSARTISCLPSFSASLSG